MCTCLPSCTAQCCQIAGRTDRVLRPAAAMADDREMQNAVVQAEENVQRKIAAQCGTHGSYISEGVRRCCRCTWTLCQSQLTPAYGYCVNPEHFGTTWGDLDNKIGVHEYAPLRDGRYRTEDVHPEDGATAWPAPSKAPPMPPLNLVLPLVCTCLLYTSPSPRD